MSHVPPPQTLPPDWIACQSPDGRTFYYHQPSGISSWNLPPPTVIPPPPSAYPPPPGPAPQAPPCPPTDVFDISGTSVASLQNFLDTTADITCRQALFILLPHCPGLAPSVLESMLVANGWEVQHVQVAGLVDQELKLAVRMFTVELPYPLYRTFNNPFFDKACTPPPPPIILCRNGWRAEPQPASAAAPRRVLSAAASRHAQPHAAAGTRL